MHHGASGVVALPAGHLQGVDDQFGADVVGDRPAHDLAADRVDMADSETAVERRDRARVDGLLLVIAMVSAASSIATITGVAIAYWTIARPQSVDVEWFTGWWILGPVAVMAATLGYHPGRQSRRRHGRALPPMF